MQSRIFAKNFRWLTIEANNWDTFDSFDSESMGKVMHIVSTNYSQLHWPCELKHKCFPMRASTLIYPRINLFNRYLNRENINIDWYKTYKTYKTWQTNYYSFTQCPMCLCIFCGNFNLLFIFKKFNIYQNIHGPIYYIYIFNWIVQNYQKKSHQI